MWDTATLLAVKTTVMGPRKRRPRSFQYLDIHDIIHLSFTSASSCTRGSKGFMSWREAHALDRLPHGKTYSYSYSLRQTNIWTTRSSACFLDCADTIRTCEYNTESLARQVSRCEVRAQTNAVAKICNFFSSSKWVTLRCMRTSNAGRAGDVKVLDHRQMLQLVTP